MGIHWERLTSATVSSCAPLWSDRATYSPDSFERALATLRRLLDERRATGAVIIEDGRVRGFGATVFVDRAVVEGLLAAPTPQFGKALLLGTGRMAGAVRQRKQIGEGNATSGLELVVVNTNYDTQARDPDAVIGAIIAAYQAVHRGYRIARLINETIGDRTFDVVATSASFDLHARFSDVGGVKGLPCALFTLTRQQAAARRNPLLAMFVYSPPRVCFTEAEQDIIRIALTGETDAAIAQRLAVPLTAVKSRWTRLQQRAFTAVPEAFRNLSVTRVSARGRGPQIRHIILEYVRHHPAELTPYVRCKRQAM